MVIFGSIYTFLFDKHMKDLLRIEEFAMFLLGCMAFSTLPFAWWWFPLLLFVPDIGLLGYLINPKIGGVIYNVFHHKAIAILLGVLGIYLNDSWLQLVGVIFFAHSSMDRILGYGLKHLDAFKNTHLGQIEGFKD